MWGEAKHLRELCDMYQKRIAELQKRPKYITTYKPDYSEQLEYWRKLSTLNTDDSIVYYFAQMREGIVAAFSVQGKEYSEYFRGKLAAIDDIIEDSRNALKRYNDTLTEVKDDEI